MTAYPAWTPASRPGIIPLHPLGFGTILGRSFVALRQNPRVLLGFALVVQTLAYLVLILAVAGVAWLTFSRLDTLRYGTEEFNTVMAGSVAITAIAGVVLGLAVGALTVIVQGIVVNEVAHAAVAEKLTLGELWRDVKPVVWRLIGYSFLLVAAVSVAIGLLVLAVVGIGIVAPPAAIALTVLLVIAAIPLTLWLSTKLLLAPAVIILEHGTIRGAIARSWTLVRGRFWVALGVIVVISLTFNAVSQVIGIPFTLLSSGLTSIIAPTGDPNVSAIISTVVVLLVTEMVTLLIQSVALVVQATATSLVYIDCRMRHEGLDLDLLAYVERRDAGATALPDPYREHIGRAILPRATAGYAPAGYPQGAYPQGAYPQRAYPQGAYPGYPAGYPQPGAPAPQYAQPAPSPQPTAPPPPGYRQVPPAAAEPPAAAAERPDAPAPTSWAAPGSASDGTGRETP